LDILKLREVVRAKYADIIFYLIAFTAIAVFIGINTAIFLVVFLLFFALVSYSAVGVYNTLRGIKDKWLLWKIIGTIVTGVIVYLEYGSYALMRTVSFALVIFTITLLFAKFYLNRNK
jgi:hypothetical protein